MLADTLERPTLLIKDASFVQPAVELARASRHTMTNRVGDHGAAMHPELRRQRADLNARPVTVDQTGDLRRVQAPLRLLRSSNNALRRPLGHHFEQLAEPFSLVSEFRIRPRYLHCFRDHNVCPDQDPFRIENA